MKVFSSFFFYYQILIFFGPNPFPSVLLHAQIWCRPNSFSRPGVDAISRDCSRMQIQNRTWLITPWFLIIIKLMLYFPAPPGEIINNFSTHNHVKFPAKLGFFSPSFLWSHPSDLSYVTYIGVTRCRAPYIQPSSPQHIPHLPSSEPTCQIWGIPGHLVAFAPAEPRPTTAPRGASLPALREIWLSISIWHPESVKSPRLWQKDLSLYAHTHTHTA